VCGGSNGTQVHARSRHVCRRFRSIDLLIKTASRRARRPHRSPIVPGCRGTLTDWSTLGTVLPTCRLEYRLSVASGQSRLIDLPCQMRLCSLNGSSSVTALDATDKLQPRSTSEKKQALTRIWQPPRRASWPWPLTVTFLTPKINRFSVLIVEHFRVRFGDPSCSGFCDIARIKRQKDRQTNAGKNYTHVTAVGLGNKQNKFFSIVECSLWTAWSTPACSSISFWITWRRYVHVRTEIEQGFALTGRDTTGPPRAAP